jgi:hypothetical protein
MYSSLEEEFFFTQKVLLKKRFTNKELILHQYFFKKTRIYPENIIIIKNLIFFFVKNKDYFKAKLYLREIRGESCVKKIQIIRLERTLIKFLLSFFPDPYIHDIILTTDEYTGTRVINVGLLSFKERGIAIGRSGDYIKAVNEIFKNYAFFEEYATFKRYSIPIRIKCELFNL